MAYKQLILLARFVLLVSLPLVVVASPNLTSIQRQVMTIQQNLVARQPCAAGNQRGCRIHVARSSDFLIYLRYCNQLKNWEVDYVDDVDGMQSLVYQTSKGCIMRFVVARRYDQPRECVFSGAQLQEIRLFDALNAMAAFRAGRGSPEAIKQNMQPLVQCVGRVSPRNEKSTKRLR